MTLVGFTAARISIAEWLRPRFLPPLVNDGSVARAARDWYLQLGFVDAHGRSAHRVDLRGGSNAAIGFANCLPGSEGEVECLHAKGLFFHHLYQPADRFWLFQSIEAAIFLVLAVGLITLTIWWVRRRAE